MTVLLGILNSNPDYKVTVSYNGSAAAMRAIDSEATVISLQEGEELTMQDLLFGTLIRSGNDGAVAIAEAVAGNESTVRRADEPNRARPRHEQHALS